MAIGLQAAYRNVQASADTNGAGNTVLASVYTPPSGALVRRIWVISEVAAGLLSPTVIKASYSTDGGATYTDIGNLTTGVRARGVLVYRNFTTAVAIPANAILAVRVGTAAGAGNVARVGLDYQENTFQPGSIPTTAISVTA